MESFLSINEVRLDCIIGDVCLCGSVSEVFTPSVMSLSDSSLLSPSSLITTYGLYILGLAAFVANSGLFASVCTFICSCVLDASSIFYV